MTEADFIFAVLGTLMCAGFTMAAFSVRPPLRYVYFLGMFISGVLALSGWVALA